MEHGTVGYLNVNIDLYDLAFQLNVSLNPPGSPPPRWTFNACRQTLDVTTWYLNDRFKELPDTEREQKVSELLDFFRKLGAKCDCEVMTKAVLPALQILEGPPLKPGMR